MRGDPIIMQLIELVEASQLVSSTRSRLEKIATLAAWLRRLTPPEIEVGVRYLSGDKPGGQALFDRAISRKAEASDLRRIALVYAEAGDLDLAAKTCEKSLGLNPKGPSLLAECGAIFNLKGDRAHAEELFGRAFSAGADVWDTLAVAGSYLQVRPQS